MQPSVSSPVSGVERSDAPQPQRVTSQALVVSAEEGAQGLCDRLRDLGFATVAVADPYAAAVELSRRPLAFRAVVVSLAGVYPAELSLIGTVKTRFPHIDVFLSHIDHRPALLADAMRLGADALLADDGLHRLHRPSAPHPDESPVSAAPQASPPILPMRLVSDTDEAEDDGPVLTPEELRALLQEPEGTSDAEAT